MRKQALFSVEEWESIIDMVRIIRDATASDEDRIGAAETLAEIVMDEPMEVVAMDMHANPKLCACGVEMVEKPDGFKCLNCGFELP